MKILVTGGCGFIGSHLVERLLNEGHEVVVLDDVSTGSIDNLNLASNSEYHLIQGSILDDLKLLEATNGVEYIFHLAAAVGVFNIMNNPIQSMLTNIKGTEKILSLASSKKIPILFTSSSEIYGKNDSGSLKESDDRILGSPLTLRWSYSEAKAIDESLAFAFHIETGLESRIVRFFNTVGPRQLSAYGMVVPRFVESALSNEPIIIYGDGNQTRCFAHVYDVIDALIAIAFSPNTIGRAINIGNSFEISISDLAKKIISETGSSSKIQYISYTEAYGDGFEDMVRRVPNLSLIKELVGWEPKRNLSNIISDIAAEIKARN